MDISSSHKTGHIAINIVLAFLVLALLRLLPFNYFASMAVGHDVVVDNREGNAINFINYLAVGFLFFTLLIKLPTLKARWKELWPFALLISIYFINFLKAPYVNFDWLMYQIAFILIAGIIHLFITNAQSSFVERTGNSLGFRLFIYTLVAFTIVVFIRLYTSFSIPYILTQYNDAFINSVNEIGLMKQYYGYVCGFLVLYAFFMIKSIRLQSILFLMVLLTAFGVRSMILGFLGVLFYANFRHPLRLLGFIILSTLLAFLLWDEIILNLVYDTRFYAYMNGWDIIQKFPNGVGLGGYPIYTEMNNSNLFAHFFNIDASLNYVPNSPESDLVHIFGSLGLVAGVIHILIQLRLIILGAMREQWMKPFEKCMLYYFIFMTCFGISEDTMFTVSYWIFFGIVSGIVSSAQNRIHA